MTDDYPRAMMEAWAELYGIPLLQGESDEDLSNRMSRAYIKPDDKSVHFFALEKGTDAEIPVRPAVCIINPTGITPAQWRHAFYYGDIEEEPKESILDITRDMIKERL